MTRELLLSRVGGLRWAAVRHDGRTIELHAERLIAASPVGRIVKARVTRVVPSIQAAFVDLGDDETAFVPADLVPDPAIAEAGSGRPLQERLREGGELVVQIVRETAESKAHRATARVSLAGRRLVLRFSDPGPSVSRRIRDADERTRLEGLLAGFDAGEGSFIARTASAGASAEAFRTEARALRARQLAILERAARAAAPATLADAPSLGERLVLDAPPTGWDRVIVDSDADEALVRDLVMRAPDAVVLVRRHDGAGTLYDDEGLRDEVERGLRPRVWLPSGGRITIEQTEAFVSVDVDSGRAVRGSDPRETALRTNVEAAGELARQLRLRGLGGIVVIDFIDMVDPADRARVADELERALHDDPARTHVAPPGEFGLMQLTRRRTRAGLDAALRRGCPACRARGRVLRGEVVAADALAEWLRRDGRARGLAIALAPAVASAARRDFPAAACEAIVVVDAMADDDYTVGDG